jgi:hypothetical protein
LNFDSFQISVFGRRAHPDDPSITVAVYAMTPKCQVVENTGTRLQASFPAWISCPSIMIYQKYSKYLGVL